MMSHAQRFFGVLHCVADKSEIAVFCFASAMAASSAARSLWKYRWR